MTEKEFLEHLISDGFIPCGVILKPEKAPQFLKDTPPGVHCLGLFPLWRPDNEKRMFVITQKETLLYAQQLVTEYGEPIGYSACGYISAIGPGAVKGRQIDISKVAKLLAARGENWQVNKSQTYPNTVEVRLEIKGNDTKKLSQFKGDLEKTTVFLSISTKHGFVVSGFSDGAWSRSQPFSITVGLPMRLVGEDAERIKAGDFDTIWNDMKCRLALETLSKIYSQVTNGAMIVTAWSAIENIFDKDKPVHILESGEIDQLLEFAKGLPSIQQDRQKLKRLEDVIRDTSRLATKNRNERIAERLSSLLVEDEKSLYEQIKSITKLRGKLAHTLDDADIRGKIEFIESVLWAYVEAEWATTKCALRQPK